MMIIHCSKYTNRMYADGLDMFIQPTGDINHNDRHYFPYVQSSSVIKSHPRYTQLIHISLGWFWPWGHQQPPCCLHHDNSVAWIMSRNTFIPLQTLNKHCSREVGRSATRWFVCHWRVHLLTQITPYDKSSPTGRLILGLHPANARRRYKVTPSLNGWAQT